MQHSAYSLEYGIVYLEVFQEDRSYAEYSYH